MQQTKQLLTIKEASQWASDFLKRDISESNLFRNLLSISLIAILTISKQARIMMLKQNNA